MIKKYKNESMRLQKWNYAWNGSYFITLITQDRKHAFGYIKNGEMTLSNIGVVANLLWYEIKNHSKNVELGEFIIMPDHIHGIIILTGRTRHALSQPKPQPKPQPKSQPKPQPKSQPYPQSKPQSETQSNSSLKKKLLTPGQKRFQNQGKNTLSSIVGSYKSAVSKHVHRLGFDFAWQSRFYDQIIRSPIAFQNISAYIRNNPKKWDKNKFK